jgi:hypothetical protein
VLLVTDSGTTQVLEPVTPSTIGCTPIRALLTRAQRLLPHVPPQLVAGTVWTDSATVDGCYGFLPATTTAVSRYTVVGDTLFNSAPALLIMRAGVFFAKGEGNEGQHRVLLAAQGNELSQLFFNPDSGQFLGSLGAQRTQLDITTSGRLTHFIQETHETVTHQ